MKYFYSYLIIPLSFVFMTTLLLGAEEKNEPTKTPRISRKIQIFVIHNKELSEVVLKKGTPEAFGYKKSSEAEIWTVTSPECPRPVTVSDRVATEIWNVVEDFIRRSNRKEFVDTSRGLPRGFSHSEMCMATNEQHYLIARMHPPSLSELNEMKSIISLIDQKIPSKAKQKIVDAFEE